MLLSIGVVTLLLLLSIFGVLMARFALRYGALPEKPELTTQLESPEDPQPQDPYELVWWQDLQNLGYEYHFANGEVWRGRIDHRRYPDGADKTDVLPSSRWDLFRALRQRIEWREPAMMALHGNVLVDWSAMERAYHLKLLNGTVWQFNEKSEGLPDQDNALAWHRIETPPGVVFEPLSKVYKDLNAHLKRIREEQARRQATINAGSGDSGMAQHVSVCRVCGGVATLLDAPGQDHICLRCAKGQMLNARL